MAKVLRAWDSIASKFEYWYHKRLGFACDVRRYHYKSDLTDRHFSCLLERCWRHYIFGLSGSPSVRLCVRPCEYDISKTAVENLTKFTALVHLDGDEYEPIMFKGQRSKSRLGLYTANIGLVKNPLLGPFSRHRTLSDDNLN